MGIWKHWDAGLVVFASGLIGHQWEQFSSETRDGLVQRALDRLQPLETWLIRILGRGLLRNRLPAERWAQASLVVAHSLFDRHRYGRALTVAQEAAANSRDPALLMRAHALMGLCYDWMGRSQSGEPLDGPSDQIIEYERAISFAQDAGDPDFEAAVAVWLSMVKQEQQEVDQAFALVERWSANAELRPNTRGLVNFQLGKLYWRCRNDPQRARRYLHKATNLLDNDSNYVLSKAHYWLSEAEWAIGDTMAALASAHAALRNARSCRFAVWLMADAHFWLGHISFETGSTHELIYHFRKFLNLERDEAEGRVRAQLALATTFYRVGRPRRAETYFRAALGSGQLDGDSLISVLEHLGILTMARRRLREAIGHYSTAVEKLDPSQEVASPRLCKQLGNAHFRLKEYEQAAECYRRGLRTADPHHPDRAELLEALVSANEWKAWHDAHSS